MSLIEKAADILGLQSPPPPPTKDGIDIVDKNGIDIVEKSSIERAVSELEAADRQTESSKFSASQRTAAPLYRGASASRPLKIDWDRLRGQSYITLEEKRTVVAENFRRIKRQVLRTLAHPKAARGANLVMVTSSLPAEGKTFCSINLAISIAMEMDRTVLLVDADVAKPGIMSALGIQAGDSEMGLMDILDGSIDMASVMFKTDMPSLSVLPAGTRHTRATEALGSDRMRTLLGEMAERYPDRVIIFDSPPVLVASEAISIAHLMGQILFIVEAGSTPQATIKSALARLESTKVLGVVLNKGTAPESQYGFYGYGYA